VAVQADQPFTIDQAFVLVSEVVDTPSATDVLYRRAIYTRESSDADQGFSAAVVLHSVNVCIYAIKIGEGLKFDRDQLIDLGVSGLLHDLGMVKLPPDFFTKGQLEPSDIERLHKHPIDGHGVLAQLGENYSWLADIALQEHERHDGSGYPNQLQVDQIHEYARIIGVADFYAGLTRSRHDRRGRLPFEAVKDVGLIVLSGLFLTQNFPYAFTRYDQYHGDQGIAPYQDFIDYVDEHNGLVFWAHPEIEVDRTIEKPPLKVAMKTAPYHLDLLHTQNYTGFSAFFEGTKHIVPPGAIWDRVLNEYAMGTRERPIWAIAEGDVEGDHFSPQLSETVFLLEERTQKGALDALRDGRIYAVAGPNAHFFSLESFSVASELDRAISGATLTAQPENVTVTARLSFDSPTEKRTRIQAILIRDGEPIGNYSGDGTLDVSFTEAKTLRKDRIHYYRLDASAPNQTRLLSNPIFLKSGG
jgi:hypothetical protein